LAWSILFFRRGKQRSHD